jgi:hypothetical protein
MNASALDVEVKKLELEQGDRVVFYVDVKDAPPQYTQQVLREWRDQIVKSNFVPEGVKCLVVAKGTDVVVDSPDKQE